MYKQLLYFSLSSFFWILHLHAYAAPVDLKSIESISIPEANPSGDELKQIKSEILEFRTGQVQSKQRIQHLEQDFLEMKEALQNYPEKIQQQLGAYIKKREESFDQQKASLVKEIETRISDLIKNTQKTLGDLKQNLENCGEKELVFDDNYPKKGLAYVIQKGDVLSAIAQKYSASVKDIQNANHIADPNNLKVGQTIFIPQKD